MEYWVRIGRDENNKLQGFRGIFFCPDEDACPESWREYGAYPFLLKFMNRTDILETGKQVMRHESTMVALAEKRLDETFISVVELLADTGSKVVVSGLGKSGHIGRKIVASLCSSGTPAVFLHPAEAVHGDLGILGPGDPCLLLSKSGSTRELLNLLPVLRQMRSPIIVIVGNTGSELARNADYVLDASVSSEADPHGLLPTASSTVTLAIGDALAAATMQARGFTPEDFARFHPSGQLGRNLTRVVGDVLHEITHVACVEVEDSLKTVVIRMTEKNLGAACVVEDSTSPQTLLGIITDGDVRRALQDHDNIQSLKARDIYTAEPVQVAPEASLAEAIRLMEDRPMQISELPVVDAESRLVGLIRLHDIYQP